MRCCPARPTPLILISSSIVLLAAPVLLLVCWSVWNWWESRLLPVWPSPSAEIKRDQLQVFTPFHQRPVSQSSSAHRGSVQPAICAHRGPVQLPPPTQQYQFQYRTWSPHRGLQRAIHSRDLWFLSCKVPEVSLSGALGYVSSSLNYHTVVSSGTSEFETVSVSSLCSPHQFQQAATPAEENSVRGWKDSHSRAAVVWRPLYENLPQQFLWYLLEFFFSSLIMFLLCLIRWIEQFGTPQRTGGERRAGLSPHQTHLTAGACYRHELEDQTRTVSGAQLWILFCNRSWLKLHHILDGWQICVLYFAPAVHTKQPHTHTHASPRHDIPVILIQSELFIHKSLMILKSTWKYFLNNLIVL